MVAVNFLEITEQEKKKLQLDVKLASEALNLNLVERIVINKKTHPVQWQNALFLLHTSKKLYNTGLYLFNEQYRKNGTFLSYATMAGQLKNDVNFKRLPAKVAQQTLKLLSQNIKSFFALKKSNKLTVEQKKKLSLPRYYKKGALAPVVYNYDAIYKTVFNKEKLIQLSKTNIKVKSRVLTENQDFNRIACVRIVPSSSLRNETNSAYCQKMINSQFEQLRKQLNDFDDFNDFEKLSELENNYLAQFYNDDFILEIVYKASKSQSQFQDNDNKLENHSIFLENSNSSLKINLDEIQHFASIDANIDNFAVVTKSQSHLYNTKPLKSVNRYWNKGVAKIQEEIAEIEHKIKTEIEKVNFNLDLLETFLSEKTFNEVKRTKQEQLKQNIQPDKIKIKQLRNKRKRLTSHRNGYVDNFAHQLSRQLVNQLNSLGVKFVILGKNKNLKQEINLGKRLNQQFVQIPFNKIANKISYKAQLAGMHFMTVEESYTSKTSFWDREKLFAYNLDDPKKDYQFLGKRFTRSLFRTQTGRIVHADINGALNIARKVLGNAIYHLFEKEGVNVFGKSYMGSSPKIVKINLN